ncbi:MAG: type II toxin-antitoxin system VapC family toxin [Bacteroidota bacterium]|nr:type II toxin-antitoxin system VapC family toxin [Bacteroidota bacterium]
MTGKINVILDSDILINYSKEEINLDHYFNDNEKVYISGITYMEIFGYEFESRREEELLTDIMEKIEMININEFIINKVIEIRKKFRIKLPDAIIYATASYLNADLITFNEEDFKKLI